MTGKEDLGLSLPPKMPNVTRPRFEAIMILLYDSDHLQRLEDRYEQLLTKWQRNQIDAKSRKQPSSRSGSSAMK
jgi:hypothetical protein